MTRHKLRIMVEKRRYSKRQAEEEKHENWRKEFEAAYQEFGNIGLTTSQISDWIGTKNQYVERKLKEREQQQLKVPTGKYQESEKILYSYQQKYVEALRDLVPSAIEELRPLAKHFKELFDKNKDNYLEVLQNVKIGLFEHNRIFSHLTNRNYKSRYYWGELKLLMTCFLDHLYLKKVGDNGKVEIPELRLKIIKEFEHTMKMVEHALVKNFKETATKIEDISSNFIFLQLSLMLWAEKYYLQKDWLINYAYYLLFQISNKPDISLKDIEIGQKNHRQLHSSPFEFQFRGWRAGGEDKEKYERLLRAEFEQKLAKHFDRAWRELELDNRKRFGRPRNYDQVRWLIKWNCLGLSKDEILDETDKELRSEGIEKYYDLSSIDKAFSQFRKYDLPVK